jgi:outer membrane receptor protein involved in Fe transport
VLKGPASLLYGIMDPGGIVNTISKRPELYQHGEVTLEGATYGSRSGANATIDITGPIGKDGLAYRFIGYGINEDYWRNFGTRKETLYAPSLAWYGENTTVQFNYEHRDFYSPFDRGTALDTRTRSRSRFRRHAASTSPITACGAPPISSRPRSIKDQRKLEDLCGLQLQRRNLQRRAAPQYSRQSGHRRRDTQQ